MPYVGRPGSWKLSLRSWQPSRASIHGGWQHASPSRTFINVDLLFVFSRCCRAHSGFCLKYELYSHSIIAIIIISADCGISFQNQFGHDPNLATLCLRSMTDFFLTVDPTTRLNTFYVLNDLIQVSLNSNGSYLCHTTIITCSISRLQRDPRFRLSVLVDVLPRIHWPISCLAEKEPYLKTVSVWEERKVYPPEVCAAISNSFSAANIATKNVSRRWVVSRLMRSLFCRLRNSNSACFLLLR